MYTLISTQHEPRVYDTLGEAKTVKGREYNLYLADMLEKNLTANPVRGNTEFSAFIMDGGNRVEWIIQKKGRVIA